MWVLPCNWPVIEAWRLVGGEWHVGGFGGLIRLDWDAAERILGWYEINQTAEMMRGLHHFSRAYAAEYNDIASKKGK